MLADFVSKRGGGLLMLGGRRAFAEGGWGGTPVGEVLPVVIENSNEKYFSEVSAKPTRAGVTFPVTQVAGDERASNAKWNDLPPVSMVNSVRESKPGATVLLTGIDNRKQDQIVLAYQRYGRGKAIALPIQDSWLWRMDAKMAVTRPPRRGCRDVCGSGTASKPRTLQQELELDERGTVPTASRARRGCRANRRRTSSVASSSPAGTSSRSR